MASDHPSHSERTIESYSPELMSPRSFPRPVPSSWCICAYYNNRRRERDKAGTHQPDHATLGVTDTQQKAQEETYQPNYPQTYNNNMNTDTRGVREGIVGWVLWVPAGRAAVSVRNFYPVLPSVTGNGKRCVISCVNRHRKREVAAGTLV